MRATHYPLDPRAIEVLTEIVQDCEITQLDSQSLAGRLADELRNDLRQERELLVIAHRYSIVQNIANVKKRIHQEDVLKSLRNDLHAKAKYLNIAGTHYAVEGWAKALGCEALPQDSPPPSKAEPGSGQQKMLFATLVCCLMSLGTLGLIRNFGSEEYLALNDDTKVSAEVEVINKPMLPKEETQSAQIVMATQEIAEPIIEAPTEEATVHISRKAYAPEPHRSPLTHIGGAVLVEGNHIFDVLQIRFQADGSVKFYDRYHLDWNSTSNRFEAETPWTDHIAWQQFPSKSCGMISKLQETEFNVWYYYAHNNFRIAECYVGFSRHKILGRLRWIYEQLPEQKGQWYHLGMSEVPLPQELNAYFGTRDTINNQQRRELLRRLFNPELPQTLLPNSLLN